MSARVQRLPSRGAFTLLELLVVMSVIGLLVALLLPALQKARESSSRMQCATNLRGIGSATRMYAADNKDGIPLLDLVNYQVKWNMPPATSEFRRMIDQYANVTFPASFTTNDRMPASLMCPSSPMMTTTWTNFTTRYTWFANNYGSNNSWSDSFASVRPFPSFRLSNLEKLSDWARSPAIIAMDRIDAQNNQANYGPGATPLFGTGYSLYQYKANHLNNAGSSTIKDYAGANAAVLDGSVKWFAWNNGQNWQTNRSHARPYATTAFLENAGFGQIVKGDGVSAGNQVSCNTTNNMDPTLVTGFGGTYAGQYQAMKGVLGYY
jgi:prepilin-type N-terminal cleavage/methylation domain-containing protein